MIKLTSLSKNHKGQILETEEYVNPAYIKTFLSNFDTNYLMNITIIYWAIGGHNPSYVKETPEQIVKLINKTK